MTLLAITDLSVRFATDDGPVQATDRVSLRLDSGEILGVVGESGCGKSVTAMAVLGLLPASAQVDGSIQLDGRELVGRPKQVESVRGRQAAMIFQEPNTSLNPVMTVGRQIGEVLRRHQGCSRDDARRRAGELLELVRIPAAAQRLDEYPHQLSGGMRQRVMIAIALACEPKVLIADEPTTALDVTIQAGVLDILRRLRRDLGTAVMIITHDLGVIADTADRVAVMYAGRKVEEADVGAVFAAPQHPYTNGLLGAVPSRGAATPGRTQRRLTEIVGRVPTLSTPASCCAFAPRCPRAETRCRTEVPSMHTGDGEHPVACFHPGPSASEVA